MGEHSDRRGPDRRGATHRLADEVRRLVGDLNRLAPGDDALDAARGLVAEARRALEAPTRRRWYEVPLEEIDGPTEARLRAEARDHGLYRGDANPLAPPLAVTTGTDGDGNPMVVGTVHLDRDREGPPGRVHGGFVAGLFDDVLSSVPGLVDAGPVVTARLSIRYRKATPLDADLRFEAVVARHSGRRIVARARCLAPDATGEPVVTAEAEALLVAVPPRPAEEARPAGAPSAGGD